jgi:hypothetical protein
MTIWLGMAALVIDYSRIRITQDELSRMAHSAAIAAMIAVRDNTGDSADAWAKAQTRAQTLVDLNEAADEAGGLLTLSQGIWDWSDTDVSARFKAKGGSDYPSAMEAQLQRNTTASQGELTLFFAPAMQTAQGGDAGDFQSVDITVKAYAAFRPRRTALLIDISRTNRDDLIDHTRADTQALMDWIYARNVVGDQVGIIEFAGQSQVRRAISDIDTNLAAIKTDLGNLDHCEKTPDEFFYFHRYFGYQLQDEEGIDCWDRDDDDVTDTDPLAADYEDVDGDGTVDQTDCRLMFNITGWHDDYRKQRIDAHGLQGSMWNPDADPEIDDIPLLADATEKNFDCRGPSENGGYNAECAHIAAFLDYKQWIQKEVTAQATLDCRDGHQFNDTDEDPLHVECVDSDDTDIPNKPLGATNPNIYGCPRFAYYDAGKRPDVAITAGETMLQAATGTYRYARDQMILVTDGPAQCYTNDGVAVTATSKVTDHPEQLGSGWDDADIEACDTWAHALATTASTSAYDNEEIHIAVVHDQNGLTPDTTSPQDPDDYKRGLGGYYGSADDTDIRGAMITEEADIPIVLVHQ